MQTTATVWQAAATCIGKAGHSSHLPPPPPPRPFGVRAQLPSGLTCRVLLAARLMLRRPGVRHSLMRLSVRMWRRPLAWACRGWTGGEG